MDELLQRANQRSMSSTMSNKVERFLADVKLVETALSSLSDCWIGESLNIPNHKDTPMNDRLLDKISFTVCCNVSNYNKVLGQLVAVLGFVNLAATEHNPDMRQGFVSYGPSNFVSMDNDDTTVATIPIVVFFTHGKGCRYMP